MATYQEILEVLAPETGPIPARTIADKLDTKINLINTQLTRMCVKSPPWITRDEAGNYTITDEGKKEFSPPTEESEKATEYQQFILFGQRIGIPTDIVNLTAEHVWRGGKYQDLKWVWQAMIENGVRSDLAKRWFHNWRSYIHQTLPPELVAELGTAIPGEAVAASAAAGSGASGKGKRDYIIGPDDMPLQVGEGAGDMDYDDAVQLSKMKIAAAARAAAYASVRGPASGEPAEQVSFIETVANAFKTFQEATAGNGAKKPIIITQGRDGVKIQEVDPGSPIVLEGEAGGRETHTTWVVDPDGSARELKPGEPVVIKQPASVGAEGRGYEPPKVFYIKPDGSVEEHKPGEPVIIKQEAPSNKSGVYLPAKLGGEAIEINLDDYFRLEDHKAKTEREQESHELKMDTLKAIKEMVARGARAFENMGEE